MSNARASGVSVAASRALVENRNVLLVLLSFLILHRASMCWLPLYSLCHKLRIVQ